MPAIKISAGQSAQVSAVPQDPAFAHDGGQFRVEFDRLNRELNGIDQRSKNSVASISPEVRKLFQLQLDVNRLTIETQLAIKAAETVTGSARQLQQLASG
jgi:hypothetical protein